MSTSEQIIIMWREKEWLYGLTVIVFYVVCVILFSLFLNKICKSMPDECKGWKLRVAHQWHIDFSFSLLTLRNFTALSFVLFSFSW